ncbi:tetratricopeptide repeat protein [Aquimarina algicola]|uniref:Tetratricopeptide repeat protein n=1 Tax=Aquimarina algicola TaxID=2589995 RepID=A0A504JEZ1_9FLAO|nr:tetratricopeptide repeat protein [Aquimarina algicola]
MDVRFLKQLITLTLLFCLLSCGNISIEQDVDIEIINSYLENSKNESGKEKLISVNKAFDLAKELQNEEKVITTLFKIGLEYYNLKEYELFKKVTLNISQLSIKAGDSISIARSFGNMGSYYNRKNIPDSAFYSFNKAVKIYRRLDKLKKLDEKAKVSFGATLYNIALIQKQFKDFSGGEANIIDAIEQFEKIKAYDRLFFCYNNLGIISKDLGENDEAIVKYQKAIEYARKTKNGKYREIQALNNIGVVFKNQKKYDLAIKTYKEALSHKGILDSKPRSKAILIDNMTYAKFLSGKKDRILESFLKSLKIRDSIKDNSGLITNNIHIAEYYKSISEDSLSMVYAIEAMKISKFTGSIKELLNSLFFLKDLNENRESLKFANLYIKLNDSVQNQERLSRNKFARIKFETEEKEQQIIEVQNQNTIYLLGILLLLTGISFASYFFRQRTKYLAQQNKIVQFQASYETETRISKRLHDELGNDIFQAMLQYQSDPHDPQIQQKLNSAYSRARDISRENNEFETDETFPEELNDMLRNYTKNGIQLMVRGLDKVVWNDFETSLKITVYRVLQELMTNMKKHSKASLVVLIFSNKDNMLTIKYSDNGVGVDKEDLNSKNGLQNTEKRIRAMNGTFIFDSEKEKGFKAEIRIPS